MTREERLAFCKQCTNRSLNIKTGLICKLTGERAAFEVECTDFDKDETVDLVALKRQERAVEESKTDHSKDILFGALWCGGGLALTLSETGYIFYGAIIYGGFQMLKGFINMGSK
jgi:hypothetical protein